MKSEKISVLLNTLNSVRTGMRADWVLAHCPLGPWRHGGKDHSPSFAIKASTKEKSICKCLSCGFGGDLMDLLFRAKTYHSQYPAPGYNFELASSLVSAEFDDIDLFPEIPEYGELPKSKDVVFPSWWLKSFQSAINHPPAMSYLKSRQISAAMASHLDVRYDPVHYRVGFPFWNFGGEVMGVQGRAIEADDPLRYFQYGYNNHRNHHIWMNEHRLDLDKPLVLVEGPFDLASVMRVYPNVAASFTSGLSRQKLMRIADASEIVTFYDFGKGGSSARKAVEEFFSSIPVTHVVPTLDQDDAGNMSLTEVLVALEEHVQVELFA